MRPVKILMSLILPLTNRTMTEAIATVAAVLFVDDAVLLVEHRADGSHKGGLWGLPAGKVASESDQVAVVRELFEETGLRADPDRLIAFPGPRWPAHFGQHHYEMRAFLIPRWSGELRGSPEGQPAWVLRYQLDQYALLPHVSRAVSLGRVLFDAL
jgi:8-oxo-dGTP pyrophosphatase MutT (NUDIX family)